MGVKEGVERGQSIVKIPKWHDLSNVNPLFLNISDSLMFEIQKCVLSQIF